ncbi:MAG: N-6 DNA methylase [Saprospiraceae bacterium]|nr:N-6 DNA methylase [Saprospiraceae bacterium]
MQPNISYYQDFEFDNRFKNGTALGSLIKIEPSDLNDLEIDENSLFGERQQELKKLYQLLGQRYDVVVTNPPYISSSRMEGTLKQYVEATYPETKSDLFASFILRCLELCNEDGLTGYMTPFVWMFISSYDKLREIIIDKHFLNNLIQLEYSGFDGATVPICTFTLRNKKIPNANGQYIRLSDFIGPKSQAPKTIEAINNPKCGWFYSANQDDFKKITGSPFGSYWISNNAIEAFIKGEDFGDKYIIRQGIASGDNGRFIRNWNEIAFQDSNFNCPNREDAWKSLKKWFPIDKGGGFVKWYGLKHSVISFDTKSYKILKTMGNRCPSESLYFYNGLTWGKITSGDFSVRLSETGSIFSDAGMKIIFQNGRPNLTILGFLNSKPVLFILVVFLKL